MTIAFLFVSFQLLGFREMEIHIADIRGYGLLEIIKIPCFFYSRFMSTGPQVSI